MTAAANVDIGWEALIAIIVIVLALTLLGIVAMTRQLREHHLRLGFFIERGDQRSEPAEGWPELEQTAELPPIEEGK